MDTPGIGQGHHDTVEKKCFEAALTNTTPAPRPRNTPPPLHGDAVVPCTVNKKNGQRWIQLPARPQLDKGRNLIRDDSGKVQYAKILEFDHKDVADRFNAAARKAIEDFMPGVDHD